MAIKLSDVKGLIIDKIDGNGPWPIGYDKAITDQSSRKIGLNLDKLIDKINEVPHVGRLTSSVIASHLIKSESKLIEYVEDK